jgi:hypothetical protein
VSALAEMAVVREEYVVAATFGIAQQSVGHDQAISEPIAIAREQ